MSHQLSHTGERGGLSCIVVLALLLRLLEQMGSVTSIVGKESDEGDLDRSIRRPSLGDKEIVVMRRLLAFSSGIDLVLKV